MTWVKYLFLMSWWPVSFIILILIRNENIKEFLPSTIGHINNQQPINHLKMTKHNVHVFIQSQHFVTYNCHKIQVQLVFKQ